jgi:hypothetical protein
MIRWPLTWDWFDWSLSRRDYSQPGNFFTSIFALRCSLCRRWTTGCREHFLCGLCESCRVRCEDEDWDEEESDG